MLAKLKAMCLHSLTVAWSYVLAFAGAVLTVIDAIAEASSDPTIKDNINAMFSPKIVGYIIVGISLATLIARLRSMRKPQ